MKKTATVVVTGFLMVRGTGLEFGKKNFQQQITSNYVIFSSETIKHGISQSSCFIEDGPLKGQNKGRSQNVRKEYHAMEITYTNHKGFSLPNLTLPRKEEASFGRYGRLRLKYLKEHRKVLYIKAALLCRICKGCAAGGSGHFDPDDCRKNLYCG